MVSPIYKGGYGVGGLGGAIKAVALNGESVAFYSKGAFAGAPAGPSEIDYVAQRGVSGWATAPLMPPATLLPALKAQDVSPSLSAILALGQPGPNLETGNLNSSESEFWLHDTHTPDTVPNWERVGMQVKALDGGRVNLSYYGASPGFCKFFVGSQEQALLPEMVGKHSIEVYELNRDCNSEEQSLRLMGVKNILGPSGEPELISPLCGSVLGTDNPEEKESHLNAISTDGNEVFFTSSVEANCSDRQLFVRLSGEKTLEISKPRSEEATCGDTIPCAGAMTRASGDFAGASEDGSIVYFVSAAPLTNEDKDSKNDLYVATIGCHSGEDACAVSSKQVTSLVQVSYDPNQGEAAEVQGVVRVAPDGSRVYFVALGVLGEGQNVEGQVPVKGADNLYVYDSVSGKTTFVTDLSGYDMGLWFGNMGEVQTAGLDGRFLVFSSYAQLVRDDTDTAKDVYRYDAETGVLSRISIGERGEDANGNDGYNAEIMTASEGGSLNSRYDLESRAISEDGSRIIFGSAAPLSSKATNGLKNVYEWSAHDGTSEGKVSLVSSGSANEPVTDFVIAPEGRDIFFVTTESLVPEDVDNAPDIYDARLMGGFPSPPAERQPCSGDACQGPLTNPAPLLLPGSVTQAPDENMPTPKVIGHAKGKKKVKKSRKKEIGRRKGRGAVHHISRGSA